MRTLLKFEADWCGPCQQIKPVVRDVIDASDGAVELQSVNVDDPANRELVNTHGVRAIPTLVLLDNGEVKGIHRGTLSKAQLERFVAA